MSLLTSLTDPAFEGSLRVRVVPGELSTRVIISGEVDFADLADLGRALERVPLDAASLVHLDLSGLSFADSYAVRRLADYAAEVRARGHEVRTSGANRVVSRVASVLGVEAELGLV